MMLAIPYNVGVFIPIFVKKNATLSMLRPRVAKKKPLTSVRDVSQIAVSPYDNI